MNEYKIVAKQTHIEINNYELGDCPKLEHTFSIYDMVYHSYYYKGIIYDEKHKKMLIPRGIDLHWIENLLYENTYMDYSYDIFDLMNSNLKLKYLPRDDVQRKAIRFMIGDGEYQENLAYPSLSVNLNTGKGKTYCTITSLSIMNMKSIIITSSINWLNQWKEFILEYTNISKENIFFITGSAAIKRLLNNPKLVAKTDIYLVSHNTIKSYGDTYGWDEITKLFKILKVGIKVYDEAHLNFDNMCSIDFYTNTYKTFYVTATPMRSSEDEDNIYQLYMKNIPSIDLFDEDNDPHTKYIALKYNSHPTPIEASNCKNQYGLDRNKYTNYITYKENFCNIMHILMNKIMHTNGKVLLYIGTNSAIKVVYDWIVQNYPMYNNNVGIYTSLIKEDKESQLSKKIILSTTKSCGAAMDIKGLKMTIVLAEPFKSKVLARQTLGRTRDNDTIYIEVVDEGFYYTKKYYLYKQDIFSKYATECTEIKLNDNQLYDKSNQLYNAYLNNCIPVMFKDQMIEPVTFTNKSL